MPAGQVMAYVVGKRRTADIPFGAASRRLSKLKTKLCAGTRPFAGTVKSHWNRPDPGRLYASGMESVDTLGPRAAPRSSSTYRDCMRRDTWVPGGRSTTFVVTV